MSEAGLQLVESRCWKLAVSNGRRRRCGMRLDTGFRCLCIWPVGGTGQDEVGVCPPKLMACSKINHILLAS
jgi:hypothetical protein